MEPRLAELLREIEEQSQQHGEVSRIARETGQLLNLLVKATRATHILQVGSEDGYTTLWLAEAAAVNGGIVTTVEGELWQAEIAQQVIDRSPHADRVNFMQGDPAELLAVLEGPFDFVLLDAEKSQTLHYFHLIFEQISSGALICCEKAISMAGVLTEYLTYVHDRPGLESSVIPVGEGIEVTYKSP